MKLDEFVANVLQDINTGLSVAKEKTNRGYTVEITQNHGVNFDIAVTTTKSSDGEVEGKAKVGIIEVLGAGVNAKVSQSDQNSEVSRIQFTVYVPPRTKQEDAELDRQIRESNEERTEKYGNMY